MALMPQQSEAVKRLIEIGIIPPECLDFELHIHAHDVVRVKIERYVSEQELQQICDALEADPAEAREIARRIVFRAQGDPRAPGVDI